MRMPTDNKRLKNPRSVITGGRTHSPYVESDMRYIRLEGSNLVKAKKNIEPRRRVGIKRFIEAQQRDNAFKIALKEIEDGQKKTHWIWYIIPQLNGLGESFMCEFFGIKNIHEARTYLRNKILRTNLRLIMKALLKHSNIPAVQILGVIDAQKLWSCATLFYRAATTKMDKSLFKQILDVFFKGAEDEGTLKLLGVAK